LSWPEAASFSISFWALSGGGSLGPGASLLSTLLASAIAESSLRDDML
jgi:hypothetical protein